MSAPIKILHLEDTATDAMLVRYELEKAGLQFEKLDVDTREAFIAGLKEFSPDIILSDHSLPTFNSTEALQIYQGSGLHIPFILVTSTVSEEFAVSAMHNGAADYILKDRMQRLPGAIMNALEKYRIEAERQMAFDDLNRLFNTIDEVFFSRDVVNDRLIQISPACKNMYGYTAMEFMADHELLIRIIDPDHAVDRQQNYQILRAGMTVLAKYRITHKDKGFRWVETKLVPTLDDKGVLVRLDGVTRDITDKKNAEEQIERNNIQLKEATETQSAILNALPPCIALLDETGDIIAVNDSWKKFADANGLITPNYALGCNYIKIAGAATWREKEYGIAMAEGIKSVIAGEAPEFTMEYPCHSPMEQRWFQAVVAPLIDGKHKGAVVAHINITERVLSEQKLFESEKQYRNIVETAQEGIWVIDQDMVTVFVNKKMCDMLGYSADEIIGRHHVAFMTTDDKIKSIKRIQQRDTGTIENYEVRLITKSGSVLICSVTTNSILDHGDRHLGTLAMVTDITQRKADEETLRRSEANLSAIIENTTDMVYSLDSGLNFITYNERFKKTIKIGYGFDIHEGVNALELLRTYDAKTAGKWEEIYARALAGETLHFVNEYPFNKGKIYLSYSINPIRGGGRVLGLSCFSKDITQQRLDELILLKSEANLRSVFENTDLNIVLLDTDLKVVSYNSNAFKEAIKVFGKKLDIDKSAFNYFPRARWPVVTGIVQKIKGGETVVYEAIYDIKRGGKEWYEVRWTGIFNEMRENLGIVLTMKNITEKKVADLEREKMTADLLKRNQDLEQFTYIISHNLRAPVANIKGLANLLGYFEYTDDECVETITALSKTVSNLDGVIMDLNTILQTGKDVNEKRETVSLPKLVEEVSEEIRLIIDKNHAAIICDFEEVSEIVTIKTYLYSIFQNLLVNGIKYRRSEFNPQVTIIARRKGEKVFIHFSDNGKGIDLKKFGPHLFGLYKRFDFSVEGKGMGLFMVKMQVEALGGVVTVRSEPGSGTEFVIELPA